MVRSNQLPNSSYGIAGACINQVLRYNKIAKILHNFFILVPLTYFISLSSKFFILEFVFFIIAKPEVIVCYNAVVIVLSVFKMKDRNIMV